MKNYLNYLCWLKLKIKNKWRDLYKMQYNFLIGTVRFNNETYKQNLKWRERKNLDGCGYGLDKPLSMKIPQNKEIYILEMNNSTNTIMGIGKIKNLIIYSNRSRIYDEERWNNYVYKSPYFRTKKEIIKNDKTVNNDSEIIFKILENILFYGSRHFKRGQGCIILPWERILTTGSTINFDKRKYICKKCGLPKKNHICKGYRIRREQDLIKLCPICGKKKKGHICKSLKKNFILEKILIKWFDNLFKHI
tara:strand:- start:2431 stop:3177 length:747 start_codon:yes stop_codon:yes gene_type:complete